jgi:hypothetical protein
MPKKTNNNKEKASSSSLEVGDDVVALFGGLSIASFLETRSELMDDDDDDDSRSVDSLQFYRRAGRLTVSEPIVEASPASL